ncbi:hypothetical protein BGZ63DRAFT_422277 [Mariannaea sp. PMI_226]|nr:hypothetical protein BGZ63DRAFT_422277 [Mariannaea sp. PMI_226]
MGHSSSKETPSPRISEELVSKGLSKPFRISYNKAFSLKTSCLLTDLNSDEPSYIVNLPHGWYGDMVLHGGPTINHPPLVTATSEGRREEDFAVNLPAIETAGIEGRREIVRHVLNLKKDVFWFGFRTGGQDESCYPEMFEWRHSRGDEVKKLGQSSTGWKLVRLGSGGRPEEYDSQQGTVHVDGFTKDGKEVVAVWAHGKTFGNVKNMGEFHFLGSGATGELGLQWSLMAIMSCFCVWLRTTQQSTTTAGM